MTSFLENITDATLLNKYADYITSKHITKGTLLQQKDDKHPKIYHVKKGCLRSYTIDEKGKEHIFMFAPEGWTMSDIESQANMAPAQLYIDAIEDSDIEILNRSTLAEDAISREIITHRGVEMLMKRIAVLQRRVIMLMSATALERYNDFLETYPNIVQRVPQKMIASYLGITPEALSKIRGQIAKKKKQT
jgi:CRP-like cAMP-binding protein